MRAETTTAITPEGRPGQGDSRHMGRCGVGSLASQSSYRRPPHARTVLRPMRAGPISLRSEE
jgi:hypothetical protein